MQSLPDKNRQSQQQITHGLQYLPREKQPSMFQLLSWEHNPLESKEWLLKMQPNYTQPKITQNPKYEKPQRHVTATQQIKTESYFQPNDKKEKGHKILHELYYYGGQQQNKPKQGKEKPKKQFKPKIKEKQIKRLNQFDQNQKRQIDIRKKHIQRFSTNTRELPDSAFTTYFGKPAFATYGIGAKSDSVTKHKSFSVMPHAGQNHPQQVQSHHTALNKANVINLKVTVPKKSTFNQQSDECKINVNQYYNVQIVKPDLVNQVKFANNQTSLKRRQKTPKHNEINYLPSRVYASPVNVEKSKKKRKQVRVKSEQKDDGLTFMHRRQHFRHQIEQKKKNQNKLAYKPTECYPLDFDYETSANSTARLEKWKSVRPAGVSSTRNLKANSWWGQ